MANQSSSSLSEPVRQTPIIAERDVIVCGGGPAGIAAAVAAARAGARVQLIEVHGCLGGVWTAGMLSHIIDYTNKAGIMAEIMERLEAHGCKGPDYDVEVMKLVLDQLCAEAGVRVRLHTRVVAAFRAVPGRLTHAITESKSGREGWQAKIFVDATGDGDLAALAGCGFDVGHPETGDVQPMSLMAMIGGVRMEDIGRFVCSLEHRPGKPKEQLLAEMRRAGCDPSYGQPTLFRIRDDLFAMMANHEYGVSAFDAQAISDATVRARAEVHTLVDGLRRLGGIWGGIHMVATGSQIGVREGRRIHGAYTLSAEDLREGARFDDAVCRATFCVDIHSTRADAGKGYDSAGIHAQPYDIPLRALIARDVEGLLLAGRCISGDFFAHASYRVTGNAVAMGEAAGKEGARRALAKH